MPSFQDQTNKTINNNNMCYKTARTQWHMMPSVITGLTKQNLHNSLRAMRWLV